ncbi:hypothetical protein BGX34_000535 [Mortierella sp. NVP85]|nr:hypothetical protein BGX34_000535 [Mortierella sp. NVP85]
MLQLFARATRVLVQGTTATVPFQRTHLIAPSVSSASNEIANRLPRIPYPRSSPILWTRAASLTTSATTSATTTTTTSTVQNAPKSIRNVRRKATDYTWEWTPERDAQLLELRKTFTPWRQITTILRAPIAYCLVRYKALQDKESKGYQVWSDTLETSTEREKSIPQFQRLIVQGKTYDEIGTIMGTTSGICETQWSELRKRLAPKDVSYFPVKTFKRLLEDPLYRMDEEDAMKDTEKERTRSLLGAEVYDWKRISEALHSRYSPEYLQHRFLSLSRVRARWSPEDMDALRKFCQRSIKQLGSSSSSSSEVGDDNIVDKLDWHTCSDRVFHGRHNPFDCRSAWIRMNARHVNVPKRETYPPWTVPEIMEYYQAWRKHGTDWAAIAKSIPSSPQPRSAENCSRAFATLVRKAEELLATPPEEIDMTQTYFLPLKTAVPHFRWTLEDVENLKRIVQEEQNRSEERIQRGIGPPKGRMIRWEVVAKELNNGATMNQCRHLWNKRLKLGIAWQGPIVETKRLRPADLKRLLEVVEEERPQNPAEWDALRQKHFPAYVGSELRHRWAYTALPNLTQSRLRMDRLEMLFLEHGENWHHISATLSDSGGFTTTTLCKQAWKSRVLLSNPTWSPEEVNQLLQEADERQRQPIRAKKRTKTMGATSHDLEPKLMRALMPKDWSEIGKLFYPSKTAVQCRAKWTEIKMPEEISDIRDIVPKSLRRPLSSEFSNVRFSWTKERVKVLVRAIEKYGTDDYVIGQIADQLGTTKKSCVDRWSFYRRTNQVTCLRYRWDERRTKIMLDKVAEFEAKGRSRPEAFHQVAIILGDCKAKQVATRWRRLKYAKGASSPQLVSGL